jgi:hypothetical protein
VVTGPTGETVVSVDVEVTPAVAAIKHTEPAPEPPPAVTQPVTDAAVRPPGHDPFTLASGFLAILAGLMVFMGLLPAYRLSSPLPYMAPELVWYVLITAAVAVTAGGCTFLPGTRRLIGLGILLSVAFASVSGLLLFFAESNDSMGSIQTGYWFEVIGHLTLILAAFPAAWAVKRAPAVRLVRRLLRSGYDWIMVSLGVAGAVALVAQYLEVVGYSSSAATSTVKFLYLWAATMAFVVPWCVVACVPRQFGFAVLAGWIATGSAIFLGGYIVAKYGSFNRVPGVVFECTLLLLAVAGGLAYRRADPPG